MFWLCLCGKKSSRCQEYCTFFIWTCFDKGKSMILMVYKNVLCLFFRRKDFPQRIGIQNELYFQIDKKAFNMYPNLYIYTCSCTYKDNYSVIHITDLPRWFHHTCTYPGKFCFGCKIWGKITLYQLA